MNIKLYSNIDSIDLCDLEKNDSPFTDKIFFRALEESSSVGERTGWFPTYITLAEGEKTQAFLPCFIKTNSYGEYIFDWSIARAYEENNIRYYPKIVCSIPFTPVNSDKFLVQNNDQKDILISSVEKISIDNNLSSAHFLFISDDDCELFRKRNWIIRKTHQYHFYNRYKCFDDFLSSLKMRSRKKIKKERSSIISQDVQISRYTGDSLTQKDAREFYQFYLKTIDKKYSYDYLTEEFFVSIVKQMPKNILILKAKRRGEVEGMSLFFYKGPKLYGRYWGSLGNIKNLHFELCYYQGIEFCLEQGIDVFEAGAQGEHKIARGFIPTPIYSATKLFNPSFHQALEDFAFKEALQTDSLLEYFQEKTPYKKMEGE